MADPIDINKQIEELMSLQPVTTRPRPKSNTSAMSVVGDNPRTAITAGAGAYAVAKGTEAWQNIYRDIGKTMKASGKAEAEAVKELTAMGFNAKGTMPKVGSKEFVALAREAAVNQKLGWIPYFGQRFSNASATTQLPKVQLTGSPPLTTRSPAGIGVLKPAQVTPPLSAKTVLELAKAGRISPQGALNTTPKFTLNEALPPEGVSNWTKAGKAYANMMGGDVKINSMKNLRSGFKGARLAGVSSALELGGGLYDVFGDNGVYMNQYRDWMEGPDFAGKQALAVAGGALKSGMRMGRGAGDALTWGGLTLSGAPDWKERETAHERATRIYLAGNKQAGDKGNELYPLIRGAKTMSKDSAKMAPDEKSKRWQQIYSDELSKEGVPDSWLTPDMYKGPEYEYVFGREPRLLGGATQPQIDEYYARLAYNDEQNANVTPSMRVNDFMTGLWR